MMLSIHYQRLHSFAVLLVLGLFVFSTVTGADVPLTEIGSWNDIDFCAQSCAISASSAFSSQNACPSSDPASCICNVAPAVANVAGKAHVCGSINCKAFPSSSEDGERARAALTSYCSSNGVRPTVTGILVPSSHTPAAPSSSMIQVPATTMAPSTSAQPLSSPSMVTSTTSNISTSLGSLATSLTATSVQATTPSSSPQSSPGWMYTATGKAVMGVLMIVVAILIISTLCWMFRKCLRIWGLRLAIKLRLMKESEGVERADSDLKETDETGLVERSDASCLDSAHANARRSLHPQLLHVTTKNGQMCDCHAKLDSGADDNFISLTQLKNLGYDQKDLEPCQHVWNAFGDPRLKSLGSLELTWTTQNRTQPRLPVTFYVLDASFNELVLGQKFSFKEGLLVYNRTAWAVERNKKMSKEERDRLRREKEEEAAQSLARRSIQWIYEASTGLYFYVDAEGRKVYQNQGGIPTRRN